MFLDVHVLLLDDTAGTGSTSASTANRKNIVEGAVNLGQVKKECMK